MRRCTAHVVAPPWLFFLVILMTSSFCRSEESVEMLRMSGREKVRSLFDHGFNNYLIHGYPRDELQPLSCSGRDTWGNYSLSLVDSLDTLVVMGKSDDFISAVHSLLRSLDFNKDFNSSVFESNIRVLGGLLSAHLLITNEDLGIKPDSYNDELLALAEELGRKLLPAFDTPTGMPYGTVNFQHGVPPEETPVTCTAAITSFSLEFGYLSLLTGDHVFETVAKKAVRSLWQRRSQIGLVGSHINVLTGTWTQLDGGIGGGVDSLYEYLLKAWILFGDEEYFDMFLQGYDLVERYVRANQWYVEVNMESGSPVFPFFSSLQLFWPGVQVLLGDVNDARGSLLRVSKLLDTINFFPEAFNLKTGQLIEGREGYPLRPEFVESLWYLYRATKDPSLLRLGNRIVDTLTKFTRVPCGVANVANIRTNELDDKMESFFLGETLKYLYLLFDEDNYFNTENYVFTTEAHPFPVTKLTQGRGLHHAESYDSGKFSNESTRGRACDRFCKFTTSYPKSRLSCPRFHHGFGLYSVGGRVFEEDTCLGEEFFAL